MIDRLAFFLCMASSFLFLYSACGVSESGNARKVSRGALNFFLVFLCLYWSLLIGLQYYAGADYPTYYKMFLDGCPGYYFRTREYGFFYLADFVASHFHPQVAFFLIALIQSICFCIFFKYANFERPDLFILVYFTCATAFINSTNGLRQSTAMYIFLIGILFLRDKKYIAYVLTLLIASIFHTSVLYLLVLLVGRFWFTFKNKWIIILELGVSIVICFVGMDDLLNYVAQFTRYRTYIGSSYATTGNRVDLINILTKLIYVPFYVHLLFLDYSEMDKKNLFLVNIGFFCFCIKLMGMSSYYICRFAFHFDVVAYLPMYFYMLSLKKSSMKKEIKLLLYFILLCVMICPFVAKTCFFPVREYAYRSILTPFFN